jgi:hypothetical protein
MPEATPVPVGLNGGVNLSDPPDKLGPNELRLGRNSHYLPESQHLAKIPGNTLFAAVGAAVKGLHWIKFRNGNAFLLAAAGTSYYQATSGLTGSWSTIATGLTAVGRMEATYYNGSDRVYMSDGVNGMRVWAGSGNSRAAGLTAPTSAGTLSRLANGATEYLPGATYYYCHTEYDSVNDIESAPSPVANISVTTKGDTIKYTLPTATNGSADKIRVYKTQQGGSVFYLAAEAVIATDIYYDGEDDEATASSPYDNEDEWGAGNKTIDDSFLATRPLMPMVGEPLKGNYITVNGTIPIGTIQGVFQSSLYVSGVSGYPQDVYFSQADYPELFPQVNYIRVENGRGDPVTAIGTANDRLIIFTMNSIHRLNTWPETTDPFFGLGLARLEEITKDNGCVAKRTVVNFGITESDNWLFYLSNRGPMMTDGESTIPLYEDLNWSSKFINFSKIDQCVAMAFPKYAQIWLAVPSADSDTLDTVLIYHYHPNHMKKGPIGKWLLPTHKRVGDMTVAYDANTETRLYVADSNSTGNVYVEDSGTNDTQNYDDATGKIDWEWITGDKDFGATSKYKRIQRVFMSVLGTSLFRPLFTFSFNKEDSEHGIELIQESDNQAGESTFGTSIIAPTKTRTYRGGVWKTASHFRFRMKEVADGDRAISSCEAEVEGFGAQR